MSNAAASVEKNRAEINNSIKTLQEWLSSAESLRGRVQGDIDYSKIFIEEPQGLNFAQHFQAGEQSFSLNSDHPIAENLRHSVVGAITDGNRKISTWLTQGLIICNQMAKEAKATGGDLAFCEDPKKAIAQLRHLDPSARDLQDPAKLAVLAYATAIITKKEIEEQIKAPISHSSPQRLGERVQKVNVAFKPLQKMVDDSRLISGIAAANSTLQAKPQRKTNLAQMPSLDERRSITFVSIPIPQFEKTAA